MKIPWQIEEALQSSGLPWRIDLGTSHYKIVLGGRFVGILPKGKFSESNKRGILNIAGQIRRAAREKKHEDEEGKV